MFTRMWGVGAVLLLMLAGVATAQEDTLLRYLPSKEPLIYRKVHTRNQTQTVMNKDIKTESTQTEVSQWSVSKGKDHLEVKTETKSILVKAKVTGQEEYTFDSRKNDNEKGSTLGAALTPLYDRLSTAQITLTVSPQGKIMKVEGYKELLGDLFKDNPIAAQFAAGGSEEAGKLMFGANVVDLPEKKVQKGDRWESKEDIKLDKFGSLKAKRTYVLEGEGKVGNVKTVKVTFNDEMSIDLDLDSMGAKVTGTLSVLESKGSFHFDAKNGRLVSLVHEFKLGGNLNVAAGNMNIAVANEQVEQIRIELLDKLPE